MPEPEFSDTTLKATLTGVDAPPRILTTLVDETPVYAELNDAGVVVVANLRGLD